MKIYKVCMLITAFFISSLALAEGGGDRTFERMMQASQQAMKNHAEKNTQGQSISLKKNSSGKEVVKIL